ncbi:aldo/keto reductase [Marinobacter alexandrii]|uniref:aldo/keto reductase n=1 Tax=Marinobacter alexandrii TaxID=2570351 RepID=UPI003298E1D9
MSWMRPLGGTGTDVSAIGLGTVKLGRNSGVKYPQGFELPNDHQARQLLDQTKDLGINLLDTAPAYGSSEERLGGLLRGDRNDWVIVSKVGEEFSEGRSRYEFSPEHTRFSVERSLGRLRCEHIDVVLIHSNGDDMEILQHYGTLDALAELKQRGLIGSYGMSVKTLSGGLEAAKCCDVLMVTYNPTQQEQEPVLQACHKHTTGVLIKKALSSGHLNPAVPDPVQASMNLSLGNDATSAVVVGTLSESHLRSNVAAARKALEY